MENVSITAESSFGQQGSTRLFDRDHFSPLPGFLSWFAGSGDIAETDFGVRQI